MFLTFIGVLLMVSNKDKQLTFKQSKFFSEYMKDLNATQAAIRAGYSQKTAKQMGFGCSEPGKVKIIGDNFPDTVCTDFKLPELVPLRFSLPHVCKSICKQILLLAKSAFRGNLP